MKIYFSGVNCTTHLRLLASENASVMISPPEVLLFPSIAKEMIELKPNGCADSGAYQGLTDAAKYAATIEASAALYPLDWYANLDVIGDQKASHSNYQKLASILPANLARKVLWVYQGGDLGLLREMAIETKYIGVGGLVPISSDFVALRSRLEPIGEVLIACNAKAHLFGINGVRALKWASLQPWFESADSTAWLYGLKATEIFTTRGDRVRMARLGLLLSAEERARNNIRVIRSFLDQSFNQLELLNEDAA